MKTNPSKSPDNIHLESVKGFTLIELLVAFIIGSIVLSLGFSATNTLYRAENKSRRADNARNEISRALAYIQNEVNNATSVEVETGTDCTNNFADASSSCLKINNSDGSTTLYGFQDIKDITSSDSLYKWLKPGLLKRKKSSGGTYGSATVLVDGLAVTNITTPTCDYSGNTIYNNNKGFQFCLADPDDIDGDGNNEIRGVQVFLFGYAGSGSKDTAIELNNLNIAKSL